MLIIIPNKVYKQFHLALKAEFLKYTPINIRSKLEENEYALWFEKVPGSQTQYIIADEFAPVNISPKYFYNKNRDAEKGLSPKIKDDIFIKACEKFLRLKPPFQLNSWDALEPSEQSRVLLQLFIEAYEPTLFLELPELRIFDRLSGRCLFEQSTNNGVVDSKQNQILTDLIVPPVLDEVNNDKETPLPALDDVESSNNVQNKETNVVYQENIEDPEQQRPFTTSTELNGDENTPLSNLDPVESAISQNVEVDTIDQEDIKSLKLKRQLIDIIENYFKCLNRGSYGDAFLCWHPEVRAKIYPNGLNQFYESHYFIKSIDLVFQDGLVSFWEDLDDVSFSCNIEKSINGYVSSDVKTICRHSSPNHRGSDNFNTFKKSFERLVSKAEREGFYLANEPIGSFLNFSVFEEIYSLAAFNQDRFKRFLPDLEVVSVRSQVEFQFSKFEEKLMIVAIGNRLYGDISINPENLSNPFKNLK